MMDFVELLRSNYRKNESKSNVVAENLRRKSNEFGDRGEFYEALIACNQSACFAVPSTKALSVAYANRSKIFFKCGLYMECLENIKLARDNGYPAENLHKLEARDDKCKKLLEAGNEKFDVWSFFKLSHPANEKIPFIINCLDLREDEKFGRHIFTTQDLKTGDFIAIEEPFCKIRSGNTDYSRCSHCLKSRNLSLVPCTGCTSGKSNISSHYHQILSSSVFFQVMYCSDECANHDASHKKSCPFKVAEHVEIKQKFIVETLEIVGDLDSISGLLIDDMKKTVFDFDLSNSDDPMYKKSLLMSVNSLSATVEVKGLESTEIYSKTAEREELQAKIASTFLRIWATNCFNMHEDVRVMFGPASGNYEFGETFGSSIFPFMSLLNHSCYPNVTHITVDNKYVLTVTRPIKNGEQIFISYGYSSFRYTRDERRQKLARYKFNCECIACIEDYPKLEKLPKVDRRRFKEPDFGVYSTEAAIKQFKMNCKYIEKNIKDHPTYEVMQLILHNDHLLHAAAKIYFDDIGIEYL